MTGKVSSFTSLVKALRKIQNAELFIATSYANNRLKIKNSKTSLGSRQNFLKFSYEQSKKTESPLTK